MQCKSRRRHRVHRTVSSGAKQEGAAETKRQQKAEEGDPTPRTVSSRAEQAAGAAAPRTGASGDKWRPDATDGCIRDGTRRRRCRPPDWIIQGEAAAERQGLDHPGRIKQQEPPHPRLDHPGTRGGRTPRTGASAVDRQQEPTHPRHENRRTRGGQTSLTGRSGLEQEGAATSPGAGERWSAAPGRIARGGSTRRGPHPQDWSLQGKEAGRGGGNRRPRPRWCSEGDKPGSNAKDNAVEMQRCREVDKAEETQGSKDEDGAVVKQRNRPMDKAGVMQRSSCEIKAVVQQRGGGEDEAAKR